MDVALIRRFGSADEIEVVDVPMPVPGPGELLIRTHAIGVGMPDVLIRRGRYPWAPPLPVVLGIELTGRVISAGVSADAGRIGQAVHVSARDLPVRGGCYTQYIAVPEAAATALPPGVDLDEACCLSNFQVAYHLVHSAVRGADVRTALVIASAGGVGSAAVQLGKLRGWTIIGVDGSTAKEQFARKQGVDHWLNYRTEDVTQAVRSLTDGRGVDLVLDPVGGPRFPENFARLASLGLVVNYGVLQGPPPMDLLTPMREHYEASPAVRLFTMHSFDSDAGTRRRVMQELLAWLVGGRIRPVIDRVLPLRDAGEAHKLLESGGVMGKLLLRP